MPNTFDNIDVKEFSKTFRTYIELWKKTQFEVIQKIDDAIKKIQTVDKQTQLNILSLSMTINVPRTVSLSNYNHMIIINDSGFNLYWSNSLGGELQLLLKPNENVVFDYFNQKIFQLSLNGTSSIRIFAW